MQFTTFYYNISNFIYLNGHKSASLHCIKNLKRYSNRSLYADSIGGTCFLLRCIKAELYHGRVINQIEGQLTRCDVPHAILILVYVIE